MYSYELFDFIIVDLFFCRSFHFSIFSFVDLFVVDLLTQTHGWHTTKCYWTKLRHKNDIKVVFLGDSITSGWGGNGKETWNKYYAPRGAYNYGIGGDTTQNVLWRIRNHEFDGISPKFIVLKIGISRKLYSRSDLKIRFFNEFLIELTRD